MRVAAPVALTAEQRQQLSCVASSKTASVRFALRARMVLLAADGLQDKQIAAEVGVRRQAVSLWRKRFLALGIAGLAKDAPRGGRRRSARSPQKVRAIIQRTTQTTPPDATHWSTNTMARAEGVSASTVRRVWQEHGLKPHRVKSFKLSNDKRFVEKLDDVVGLYLDPPEQALVFSCDEKSQIQALDRTQPGLPLRKGRTATMTHDYKRHGTTTLFAALSTLDGRVISTCMGRHRHQEWIKFLALIDRQTPADKQLHLIVDNYATHKHPKVLRWLNPAPAFPRPLHADQRQLAEHGRAVLPRPDRQAAASRRIHQRAQADRGDRSVHRRIEQQPQAVHLDRQGRGHPRESEAGEGNAS